MYNELFGTGYHMLAKPAGPICNLDCKYCFYLEKESFLEEVNGYKMNDRILEPFIEKYISTQEIPEIQFVWQGGEPTLRNLDFYRKVIFYQKKYAGNKKIINSLQTNGVLLDEEWCGFLKENDFLVGISLDGPKEIHDSYRVDKGGKPTFERVMKSINLLKKYEIPFNILTCVTHYSAGKAREIYNFYKENGIDFIQFTPIIERNPETTDIENGLKHGNVNYKETSNGVTDFSVKQGEYGRFLNEIFDIWVKQDVGKIHVMNFEWALEAWLGLPSTICIFSKECGRAIAIEHNGDLYSCDHYVYPENKIGNILVDNPKELIESTNQKEFGRNKLAMLPKQCMECEVRFACNGECPRHRFDKTHDGESGLSYLCEDYRTFFYHIHPYMKVMVQLIENNLPASKVMEAIKGPIIIQ